MISLCSTKTHLLINAYGSISDRDPHTNHPTAQFIEN